MANHGACEATWACATEMKEANVTKSCDESENVLGAQNEPLFHYHAWSLESGVWARLQMKRHRNTRVGIAATYGVRTSAVSTMNALEKRGRTWI